MSKAFTKEDDSRSDEEDLRPAGPSLPPGAKNYMTPAGAQRLREELAQLVASPPSAQKKAAARIRYLQERIDQLQVIEPAQQPLDCVRFGAIVTVTDEDDTEQTYQIVGVDEADPGNGKISWISPLARALLGSKVGDVVKVNTPKEERELEIVRCSRPRVP